MILASGGGSNAARLIEHFQALAVREPQFAQVVAVLSDRKEAGVHAVAAALGVPSVWVEPKTRRRDGGLMDRLREWEPTVVLLAGYLQLVPADVLAGFPERVINIHPALLPDFGGPGMYGHHVHEAVAARGDQRSGITIHLADEHYDRGRVLFQASRRLAPQWGPNEIAAAVLRLEHRHFPLVTAAYLRQMQPRTSS